MNKVCVVMSTYNGEKYIDAQIQSVLKQEEVNVTLFIRDDGSSDNTRNIILKYKDNANVFFEFGENIGFRHSFLKALSDAPDCDFYAFCDQDDYWFPRKLFDTLQVLINNKSDLAFCNAINATEDLKPLKELYTKQFIPAFPESLTNGNVHGFLFVFNKKMRDLAIRPNYGLINTSHDFWLITISDFFGKVSFDLNKKVALYRRLQTSVSKKRTIYMLKKRIKSLFLDEGVLVYYSNIFLEYYSDVLSESQRFMLESCVNYRKKRESKRFLLKSKNIKFKYKFKIFINKY